MDDVTERGLANLLFEFQRHTTSSNFSHLNYPPSAIISNRPIFFWGGGGGLVRYSPIDDLAIFFFFG